MKLRTEEIQLGQKHTLDSIHIHLVFEDLKTT